MAQPCIALHEVYSISKLGKLDEQDLLSLALREIIPCQLDNINIEVLNVIFRVLV